KTIFTPKKNNQNGNAINPLQFEYIFSYENLKRSYKIESERKPAPGIDHQTAWQFGKKLNYNLGRLTKELHDGYYQPKALLRIETENKKKPIFITTFRDRIVQRTLVRTLSFEWEKIFSQCSYAFRPGKSYQNAQERVLQICQTNPHIAIIDIKRFFESIPHDRMYDKLIMNLKCRRTVNIIMRIISHEDSPDRGLVRGAIISPLLSNLYLNDFDWQLSRTGQLVRYCDDMAIMGINRKHLKSQIKQAKLLLKNEELKVHRWKKQVTQYNKGFRFLGTFFKKV
ncbi:MAG: RNA-directed DNA polymerase (Reverse transcriptase), partial [Candidatus Magnetoglobus multicellularis str. Araruama]